MKREKLKIIGFYALCALMLVRFLIAPLQHSLQEKKSLLKEFTETYKMRTLSLEKYKVQEKETSKKNAVDEDAFLKSLYAKNIPYSTLQSDVVRTISDLAEKQKLTLLSYEFSEPVALKNISEVPIVIRLQGEQKGIVALLRELEKVDKKFVLRRFENAKNGAVSICYMTVAAFRMER
jgi:Tfp pilus assembly protein PilO